jgi:hypothetical protein
MAGHHVPQQHFISSASIHSQAMPVTMCPLQESVALYDAIATRVAPPRLTEVELRLWLAAQGCDCNEATRTIKLLKSLVLADPDSHCFTIWEWVAGWTWVLHALEVHGVSWRV